MVGWVRLAVAGERGTRVQLRFAEMLEPDGSLYRENLRGARQLDTYVLRGARRRGRSSRASRSTASATSRSSRRPTTFELTGRVVHSDTPRQRRVRVLGRARQPALAQHQLGPARQLPLGPDRLPAARRAARLARRRAGLPPHRRAQHGRRRVHDQVGRRPARRAVRRRRATPTSRRGWCFERDGAPAWADAGIIVPWTIWRRYGDRRLARAPLGRDGALHGLPRCATTPTCCGRRRRGQRLRRLALGRRAHAARACSPRPTGPTTPRLMAEMAARARPARARRALRAAARRHRRRVQRAPTSATDACIEGDTQTGYLLALHMDLLPQRLRARAAERLVDEHRAPRLATSTTGFVGVGLLCPVLSADGLRRRRAPAAACRRRSPPGATRSATGATTIWERWDGWTEERGFQTRDELVQPLLARLGRRSGCTSTVAGIRSDERAPATSTS